MQNGRKAVLHLESLHSIMMFVSLLPGPVGVLCSVWVFACFTWVNVLCYFIHIWTSAWYMCAVCAHLTGQIHWIMLWSVIETWTTVLLGKKPTSQNSRLFIAFFTNNLIGPQVIGSGSLICVCGSWFKGALDNFSLIPKFFSKKLRFLYY